MEQDNIDDCEYSDYHDDEIYLIDEVDENEEMDKNKIDTSDSGCGSNIEFLEKLIFSHFNDIQYTDVLESGDVIHQHVETIVEMFKKNPNNQKFKNKIYLYISLITYIGSNAFICTNCNKFSGSVNSGSVNINNRMNIDLQSSTTTTTTSTTTTLPIITKTTPPQIIKEEVPLSATIPKKATYNKYMLKSIKANAMKITTTTTTKPIFLNNSGDNDDNDDDDNSSISSDRDSDSNSDSVEDINNNSISSSSVNNNCANKDPQNIYTYINENELGKEEFWNHLIKASLLKQKYKDNIEFIKYGKQICKDNNLNEKLFNSAFYNFKNPFNRRIVRNIGTYFKNIYLPINKSKLKSKSKSPSSSSQQQQQQQQMKSLNWFDDSNIFLEFIKFKFNCDLRGSIVKENNIVKYVQFISKIKK